MRLIYHFIYKKKKTQHNTAQHKSKHIKDSFK